MLNILIKRLPIDGLRKKSNTNFLCAHEEKRGEQIYRKLAIVVKL